MKLASGSLFLCVLSLLLQACSAGWRHTSDASLERVFRQHRPEFEKLLAEVQADSKLTTITRRFLFYSGQPLDVNDSAHSEVERLGLPKTRWLAYQNEMGNLGIVAILKSESAVDFRVDPGSLFNGDSYKGYRHQLTRPDHLKTSLDAYRIADVDLNRFGGWLAYKPLAPNWYLYLFVNGSPQRR